MIDRCFTQLEIDEIIKWKTAQMRSQFQFDPKVQILPWVGERYKESNPRILILGESVYPDPDRNRHPHCASAIYVAEVCRRQVAGLARRDDGFAWRATGKFGRNLATYLVGCAPLRGEEFVKVWENWAFWELIQDELPDAKQRPFRDQWSAGWDAFGEIIRGLDPHFVVGLGHRMRDAFACSPPRPTQIVFVLHPSYRRAKPMEEFEKIKVFREQHSLDNA